MPIKAVNARKPLAEMLWTTKADSDAQAVIRFLVLAVLGAFLLAVSAKVRVPFWPVPMTLQTFAIMALGAAYGLRLGLATVLLYLAIGAFGMDVFTGSSAENNGLAYMMGTTGGYLVGFVIAMGLVGYFAERGFDHSLLRLFSLMLAADAIVFLFGVPWLGFVLDWNPSFIQWGFWDFAVSELLKLALAALFISKMRNWLQEKADLQA